MLLTVKLTCSRGDRHPQVIRHCIRRRGVTISSVDMASPGSVW